MTDNSEIEKLQSEIEDLLLQVAKIKQIKNYELLFDGNVLKGDGFLGEFFLGAIKNNDTNESVEVAIKKAFKNRQRGFGARLDVAYRNEVYFYSAIYPEFQKLQNNRNLSTPFNNIPEYFYGNLDAPNEVIVLENIKASGYIMRNKQDLLDEEHAKFIFKTYGRFHALSFALKDQNFELYQKLVDGTQDFFHVLFGRPGFNLNSIYKQCFDSLDAEEDAKIIEHCQKYVENSSEELRNSMVYNGNFDIINHGDCWSNNMMFKYSQTGELEDMKLIDFQIVRKGTPVYDLSYFFYTGGNKELFDKLEDYLKIYHESLSMNLRELGSDPEKLYPFEQLKNDWKHYAKFGVLLSLLLVKVKLLKKSDVDNFVDDNKSFENNTRGKLFSNALVDADKFQKRCRDIILNAYSIGAL